MNATLEENKSLAYRHIETAPAAVRAACDECQHPRDYGHVDCHQHPYGCPNCDEGICEGRDELDFCEPLTAGTSLQCEGCGQRHMFSAVHVCPECNCGTGETTAANCPAPKNGRDERIRELSKMRKGDLGYVYQRVTRSIYGQPSRDEMIADILRAEFPQAALAVAS